LPGHLSIQLAGSNSAQLLASIRRIRRPDSVRGLAIWKALITLAQPQYQPHQGHKARQFIRDILDDHSRSAQHISTTNDRFGCAP
jgi:hypothetical protein